MECLHPKSKAPLRPAASLNLERASASTRGDCVCSMSRLAEDPETKARSYWRSVTTVRSKSSRGNTAMEVSSMFHTRSQLTFVLDSKPAPLLLQFCLRPGHVPRAVHLLKRPAALLR